MIEINGNLDINIPEIMKNKGLNENGYIQKFVDSEILRYSSKYIPFQTGMLMNLGIIGTVIGSGRLVWLGPYARYLYYGKLAVDPKYRIGAFYSALYGFWSRPNVSKEITDIDLNYNGAPVRGPFWFEKVKDNHLEDILTGCYRLIEKNGG